MSAAIAGAVAGYAIGGSVAAAGVGALVGSSVGGAISSNKAASTAAKATESASQRAADTELAMFERQVELQEPWRKAGEEALNKLIPLSSEYTPFGTQQFQADPGYQFRMSEGMKALERSAAARGGLLSGSTLRATQRFGQDLASQEYQNAFNRYQAERTARLNPLQSLAGVGQSSAQALAGQAGQLGSSLSQNYLQSGIAAGQARASGYLGAQNAITGGLGSALNFYQNQQFLNRLPNQNAMILGGGG
jgi:hypothetical protein